MRSNSTSPGLVFIAVLVTCLSSSCAVAQRNGAPSRINQTIDETNVTVLKGNTHPLARRKFDRGLAPSNLPLNRMLLVLQRSVEQEAAIKALLDGQQDKSSPNYHAWLTPEQFGQQFGPSDQEIQTVTAWLVSHRFEVNRVSKGRMVIEVSGTAGQLKQTFHTEIHKYDVNGKEQWANSTDPEIPNALAPLVAGFTSLHNFQRKPLHHIAGVLSRPHDAVLKDMKLPTPENPLMTSGGGCGLTGGTCYGLVPYDFATIYNVLPLWNASPPVDGTGQTIAVVGQSDIYPQDFSDFRRIFGLPPATLNIIYDGPNPGKLATQGDEEESDLDVEWSGGVAKGATIDLVVSASTNSTAGVDLSAEYIVDNDLAPVMTESYGECEFDLGTAGNQFYNQLWQQAAAEGITVFVATGDSGSAGCDRDSPTVRQGLSVSGVSSTPYNIAVGGTDFDDLQDPATYWSSVDDANTLASAKSYIPETTWNDSCTNAEFFQFTSDTTAEKDCNDKSGSFSQFFLAPVGGGGGASACTTSANQSISSCAGGYPKPSWQTGTGVPNDGKRDLPDVALFAADGLNSSFYVICETDIYGGCSGPQLPAFVAIGGTSGSAPSFAGIMAMVNQKMQSRQGNANYVFYSLAAQPAASCDATGTLGNACSFYDVTSGTIAMPCVTGSLNCVTNISGDQLGVLSGYGTMAGYDLATGLGSVNVANLVNNWNSISFQPTISTLSLNPTTQITHGTPVNLNITIAPKTGTGIPTGLVSLLTNLGQEVGSFTLANGSVSATTDRLPGGSYTVTAHYAGDGSYAASDSSPGIPVTVNSEASTTTVQAFTLDHSGNAIPFTSGSYGGNYVYLRANVAGQSGAGVPTGTVNVTQTLNGTITNFMGDPYYLNSEGYVMPGGWLFAAGTYSMAANYGGDSSFNTSVSPAVDFTITRAQTNTAVNITVCPTSGQCILNAGSQVNIFAWVLTNTSVFSTPPTGTMIFYSNGTPISTPVPVDSGTVPEFASIGTTQLPLGLDNITAQYSGDTNFMPSTSPAGLVDMGGTFAISAKSAVITVASPGQSGSTTITFAAQNGFTGSTTLSPSVCSSLPPESTCSFNPTAVAFTSSTATVPVTLTITTAGSGTVASSIVRLTPGLRAPWLTGIAFGMGICIIFSGASGCRPNVALRSVVLLALITTMTSCGGTGGSGGSGGSGGATPGTPAGNYPGVTVSVTINGITQSVNNLSVDVQ